MIRIAICDDEKEYIDKILNIIADLKGIRAITYISAYEMLDVVEDFDIFILDIEMPEINGINLAKIIREKRKDAIIIFLTNYDNYVFQGYEVGAFRYITKSKIDEKLLLGVTKAVNIIENINKGKFLSFSPDKKRIVKIDLNSVIYLEKCGKEVIFNTIHNDKISIKITMAEIEKQISSYGFIEVKKGIVVNVAYVEKLEGLAIVMKNNKVLYMSRCKADSVRKNLLRYWSK